jgi:hypothetical protein
MSKFYTYQSWVDTFKPINNKFKNDLDFFAFETYGEEQEFIRNYDPKFIWTEIDGDGGTYIVAGYSFVNRIQYYITENPWEDEYTEIPTWVYRDCDCRTEETDWEADPACEECDEGMIDIDCDSVVALKDIYGEEAPIVS